MVRLSYLLALPAIYAATLFTQQATNQTQSIPTLRTGTKLVIVDVTVTDQSHHPIHGLKAEDFAVLENNSTQPLKNFEEHKAPTAAEVAQIEPMPKMPAGVFTNFTPAPKLAQGPVNVLLVDRLNTPTEDQARLRRDLVDYLKKVPAGQRVAVFGLGSQLVLLQGFTTDPALVREALEKKMSPRPSPLMDPTTASGGMRERIADSISDSGAPDGEDDVNQSIAKLKGSIKVFESMIDAQQKMDRSKLTLEAMNALARYLVNLPGRKNLIWFSGSFPLSVLPDPKLASDLDVGQVAAPAFMSVGDTQSEYRETISLLSRAQVAVYPVDARGVTVLPNATVAGEGGSGERYFPARAKPVAPGNPAARSSGDVRALSGAEIMANDIDTVMEDTFEENSTMRDLAHDTGGRAFLNSNDLSGAMAQALDDGSNYYTLTYSPTDPNWRGDFRKIEVRLRQQGYNVSYRRGYYADDPNAPPSTRDKLGSGRAVTAALGAPPDFGAMHLALMHGGPEPTEIVFTVKLEELSSTPEPTLVNGNEGSVGLHGPFRRYALGFGTDMRGISFQRTPDGVRHGMVEFIAFVYDADGKLVNSLGTKAKLDLTAQQYAGMLQHGIPFHEEVSVPAKGDYSIRVAVHDLQGDHVGAVEVPVSAVRGARAAAQPLVLPGSSSLAHAAP